MTNAVDTVKEAASAVARKGLQSARFHAFKTLAERQGYRSGPGGYIKNEATGGTVAHGWKQFADHVLCGSIPLRSAADLDREAYYTAWDAATSDAKSHRYGDAAQESASRGDWVRALSWLTEAVAATVKPGDYAEMTGTTTTATVIGATDHHVTVAWRHGNTGRTGATQMTRRAFVANYRLITPPATPEPVVSIDPGETVGFAITEQGAVALKSAEDNDAREAYAHDLYRTPVTTVEIGAGYADWDSGDTTPLERSLARQVGIERRAVLTRLAVMSERGQSADPAALEAYAAGQFVRALTLLGTPAVCLRVDGAHVGHLSAVGAECREGGSLNAADTEVESLSAKF